MQEIIVIIVGIFTALIVIYKLYNFFFGKKVEGGGCGCSGCNCVTKEKNVKMS